MHKKEIFVTRGDSSVIIPIDEFINVITRETGWSQEELKNKDMGEIERRLEIKAIKPNNLLSIKKGKSFNELYSFVDPKKKQKMLKLVDAAIS